ncbi:hypothetical protein AVEN_106946-1 [Araneus ventricosus]|uniref:Uncharacterized protein n=1 Tax=Araneus ventricosus TaxID=182803 RepID=A0A4Y2GKE1_ARAVE|nr:hypothetical protein AVEN_106946-1 [Araneus ventricosus]
MKIPLAERLFIKAQGLERKMVIGGVDVNATEKREKGKRKQLEDKRIKCKMVRTDADADHAQLMDLHEFNTMSSSTYTDNGFYYLGISITKSFRFPYLSKGMCSIRNFR